MRIIHLFIKHLLGTFSVPGIVLGLETLSGNGGDRHVTRKVHVRMSRPVAGGVQVALGTLDEVRETFLEEGVYKMSPKGCMCP